MATGGESTTGGGKGSAIGAAAAAAVGGRRKGEMASTNEGAVESPYKGYQNSAVAEFWRLTPPLRRRKHAENENFLLKTETKTLLFYIYNPKVKSLHVHIISYFYYFIQFVMPD